MNPQRPDPKWRPTVKQIDKHPPPRISFFHVRNADASDVAK